MDKIEVKGMRFHAFHGCHEGERKVGGRFEVDVCLSLNLDGFVREDEIGSTLDYVRVMETVEAEMRVPRKLIETVAASIARVLKSEFKQVDEVSVTVRKYNAPVRYELDHVSTTIHL